MAHHQCESDCFCKVWQRYYKQLYQQSLRLMNGNRADAEDALGMAMEKAARAYPHQREHLSNVQAWLRTLLRHACVDLHRARWRFTEASEDGAPVSAEARPLGPEAAETPEDMLMHDEEERALEKALRRHIASLPSNLQTPFRMRFEEGMSYDDIAQCLELTNCNVRKRIEKSKKHLRDALTSEALTP